MGIKQGYKKQKGVKIANIFYFFIFFFINKKQKKGENIKKKLIDKIGLMSRQPTDGRRCCFQLVDLFLNDHKRSRIAYYVVRRNTV